VSYIQFCVSHGVLVMSFSRVSSLYTNHSGLRCEYVVEAVILDLGAVMDLGELAVWSTVTVFGYVFLG
jgi:hypothetical protein